MIDEQDIKLIIEALKTIIENIQKMVQDSNKSQYEESIFFPFEKHTDRTRASMIINIQYRQDGTFMGKRINIMQI